MIKEKKSKEDIEFEAECIEMQRYERTCRPGETIERWRERLDIEDKMRIVHGVMQMVEGNEAYSELYNISVLRYEELSNQYKEYDLA